MTPRRIWIAGIGSAVIVNAVVLNPRQNGSTFSETTRYVFRTESPLGRCLFLASWVGFSTWFACHVLKRVDLGELEAHLKAASF